MQNKTVRFGPVALTSTLTTNVLNPPTTTGGTNCGTPNTYIILRHVRIVNKTSGAVTFTFYIGVGLSIAANSAYDWYGLVRLDVADFLVGGASANTSLVLEAEGEIGLA